MYVTINSNIKKSKDKHTPPVFLNYAHNRIKKNRNLILVFNGGTGSGKSYACIRLAIDLAKRFGTNFSIADNLDFSFDKIMHKMQLAQNAKPGTVFILEEIGAFGSGGSSKEWQSKANKFFNSFLQTSRHRNQIFILNCPSFSFLEASSRILVHFRFESVSIDYNQKVSIFKPFLLQHNPGTGKIYAKFLRYRCNGVGRKYNRIKFSLPPQDIVDAYEIEKNKFTTELNRKIMEPEKKGKPLVPVENRKIVMDLLRNSGKEQKEIAEIMGIGPSAVSHYFRRQKQSNRASFP